jgi:thiol-disulfide isomerase/thioredoxin
MTMRRALLALVALIAVLAAACGGADGTADVPEARPALHEDRLELPEYDPEGFRALLASLEGTPVVVNVWASWCGPCRVEGPHLASLAREYEGRVQFLGVDILDNREAARDFILEFDWPYPSVFDPQGEIRDSLGFLGQPVTLVVDREGDVVFEWSGAVSEEQLRAELEAVVS